MPMYLKIQSPIDRRIASRKVTCKHEAPSQYCRTSAVMPCYAGCSQRLVTLYHGISANQLVGDELAESVSVTLSCPNMMRHFVLVCQQSVVIVSGFHLAILSHKRYLMGYDEECSEGKTNEYRAISIALRFLQPHSGAEEYE